MTPERAQQLAEAWRHRIRDDDGDNLIWDFVDAQQHEPGCDPEDALMDPDELLEDVERSGDLGRIAWAAHTVMTPKERAALNARGRRRLGRAITIVAREHLDHTVPSTDAPPPPPWTARHNHVAAH